MKKKILSILTAMMTASAVLPSFASFNTAAAENIAYNEAQLRELIANNVVEITLGADITLTEPLEFPYVIAGSTFKTLNMNGFTLDGDEVLVSATEFYVNGTLDADLIINPDNKSSNGTIIFNVYDGTFNGNISSTADNVNLDNCIVYGDITGDIDIYGSTVYGDIYFPPVDGYTTISNSVIYGDISGDGYVYPYGTFFYGDFDIKYHYEQIITAANYTINGEICAIYTADIKWDDDTSSYLATIKKPDLSHASVSIDKWYYDEECTQEVDFSKVYSFPEAAPYEMTIYGIDSVSPVITGLEADKTYCGDVTFSVTDNVKVAQVMFGDKVLTPDENGLYTIKAGSGFGTVVATDTSGNTTYSDAFRVNDDHVYSWQNDDAYYWQECINCGNTKEKYEIPQIDSEIIGDDSVKRNENYIFSFEIPSGFEQVYADADFGKSIDDIIVFEIDGNILKGAVFTEKDKDNSDSFDVVVYLTLPNGYAIPVTKTVNIIDETAVTTTTTASATTTTTTTPADSSPKTGEKSNLPVCIALFALSFSALAVTGTCCRDKKRAEK